MVDISKLLFDLSRRGHRYAVREVWRSQGEPVCSETKTGIITVSDHRLIIFRRSCNYGAWTTDTRPWILGWTHYNRKKSPQAPRREIPTAHKPAYPVGSEILALLLNHRNAVFWMSSSDVNVQTLRDIFNGLETWTAHGDMQGVWHFPQHAIQWLLNSASHKWTGTVLQQDDAFSEFTQKMSGATEYHVTCTSLDR